jgi:5-methylcytosine-specific restriction protein A
MTRMAMTPCAADFEKEIRRRWKEADERCNPHITIVAGELHRDLGGYPGPDHRMPTCCGVMARLMNGHDAVVTSPPKGKGASLQVRYKLPR